MPDRQVEPFDKRGVERRGIFGLTESLLESPLRPNDLPPLNLDHVIVSTGLEHLAVQTRDTEEPTNDLLVEVESIGHDQR